MLGFTLIFSPMSSIASEVNGESGVSVKESNSSAESKNDTQIQDKKDGGDKDG